MDLPGCRSSVLAVLAGSAAGSRTQATACTFGAGVVLLLVLGHMQGLHRRVITVMAITVALSLAFSTIVMRGPWGLYGED